MSSPTQAATHNHSEAADLVSAATEAMPKNAMSNNEKPSLWQRHRMPIILGIIAVCLYAGSIAWMVYARSQLG